MVRLSVPCSAISMPPILASTIASTMTPGACGSSSTSTSMTPISASPRVSTHPSPSATRYRSSPPLPEVAIPADRPLDLLPRSAVIAVAMSGGVDSSVAAARVAATGRRAFGITLAMWRGGRETIRDRGCCSIDSVDDARRVATMLDLPHYVWNLEEDFEADVVRD